MAYITDYPGGRHRVQVEKLGVRASEIFDNKREAIRWGQDKEREIEANRKGIGVTFGMACKEYIEKVTPKKKKSAWVWEPRRFTYFTAHFGEKTKLQAITRRDIASWRDLRLKTVAPGTVEREAGLLSNLFTIAVNEWGYITESPMKTVKMPTGGPGRENVWRWRQIRHILRYCQTSEGIKTQQVGIAFHISLRTAMRMKEVLIARLDGKVIIIDDSKTTDKGTLIKIPCTFHGKQVMEKYRDIEFVVGPNEASTLFSKACVSCGLRKEGEDGDTFHDARGTALTFMSKKMTVQRLQKISRHRDINTLIKHYYRETAEEISEELQ